MIVFLLQLSDIWPELPTEQLLQNYSHIIWCPTGMFDDKNTLEGSLICCIRFLVFFTWQKLVRVLLLYPCASDNDNEEPCRNSEVTTLHFKIYDRRVASI